MGSICTKVVPDDLTHNGISESKSRRDISVITDDNISTLGVGIGGQRLSMTHRGISSNWGTLS